jgi:HAD superfamily hydrolase (TIGR01490 family)
MQWDDVRAAFFDVDGTLVDGHVWSGVLAYPQTPRSRARVFWAGQMPHYLLRKAGLVSQARFRDGWVRGLAGLVRGWSAAQLEALAAWIATDYLAPTYRPDVIDILNTHVEAGVPVALVSTMFAPVVEAIAAHLGAEAGLGTALEFEGGVYTGRVAGTPCAGARKLDFMRAYLAEHAPGVELAQVAAFSDSFSDAPMLEAVGYPAAVYPDDRLRAAAEAGGWAMHPSRFSETQS